MSDALFGLGLVAILEGLVLALAAGRIDAMLDTVRTLGPDRLRLIGLTAVATGVGLVWLARG